MAEKRGGKRRRQVKPRPGAGGGDVRVLARDSALAALARLAQLANSDDERIALAASQELLNRAFGKSPAAASDEPSGMRPLVVRIVRFGTEEPVAEPGSRVRGDS